MELSAAIDVVTGRIRNALADYTAPTLLPLPRLEVHADCLIDDRQVRIEGEALYAVHRGGRTGWAIVVEESNVLPPGTVQFVDIADLRVAVGPGHRMT